MKAGSSKSLLEASRRRRRLVESIQKLNCTRPVCKEVEPSYERAGGAGAEMMTDQNPYFFPVAFPDTFEDEIPLNGDSPESSSCHSQEEEDPQTQPKQACLTPPRVKKSTCSESSLSCSAQKVVTTPTRSVSTSICSPPPVKRELQLPFDDARYTYSPELSPVEPEEEIKVEPLRSFDKDPGIDGEDPPLARIQSDESKGGVPMIIQFSIVKADSDNDDGENESDSADDLHHQQNSHPIHYDFVEAQSTRTPRGHQHEEENDCSRDQPSLSSKRSFEHSQTSSRARLGTKNNHHARGPSYSFDDCVSPPPDHSTAKSSSVNNHVNNFHFEFEEPPPHRCFKLKSSPGDRKPSYLCSSARQKKTLSDNLRELHKPVAVRGGSGGIYQAHQKAHPSISSNASATVATTRSNSSISSRASSSGRRLRDLIQRYDRHSFRDLGLNSSTSCDGASTTMSVPSVLKEDAVAFDSRYDFRQAPPPQLSPSPSHLTFNHYPEISLNPSETVGMVDTSLDTSFDSCYYDTDDPQIYDD